MVGYWTRFANANPNSPNAVAWPVYLPGEDQYRKFDTQAITVGNEFPEHKCNFWDGLPRP